MDAVAAENEGTGAAGEQVADRGIAYIEPAGVGAEGRQDHAARVGDEAAAAHAPAANGGAELRMEMSGDLAAGRSGFRFVAEKQGPGGELVQYAAAIAVRRSGIVIAADPDPIAKRGQ